MGKVVHNVRREALTYSTTTTAKSTATSTLTATAVTAVGEWFPCDGIVERVVSLDLDTDQTPTYKLFIRYSPQHYYELRNKTVTTDDYQEFTITASGTAKTLVRFDADDVDDLQRPARSYQIRFSIPTTTITATATGTATVTATASGTANVYMEEWG